MLGDWKIAETLYQRRVRDIPLPAFLKKEADSKWLSLLASLTFRAQVLSELERHHEKAVKEATSVVLERLSR